MNTETLNRSSELMSADDTALLVIDVQEKLVPLVRDSARVVWNIRRLLDAAKILSLRAFASEQYPRGLGKTVGELADRLPAPPAKLSFSCGGCSDTVRQIRAADVPKLLLVGIETHVCVQQTALDLMAAGYRVYLAVDAASARHAIDHETALRRLEASGATLTTSEAAMFEWCRVAGTEQFKQISQLVREPMPEQAAQPAR